MATHELPKYLQSVFYPLFQHTMDLECQLLLLDEMLEVGDHKEIPFLKELESHDNPKISSKAFQIKNDDRNRTKKIAHEPLLYLRRVQHSSQ